MFPTIFKFELWYELRKPTVYVYFLIMFIPAFLMIYNEAIDLEEGVAVNSAATIVAITAGIIIYGLFFVAALATRIALRDYESNYAEMLFATPLTKSSFYYGKYAAAVTLSLIPYLGVYLAIPAGSAFLEADSVKPFHIGPYLQSFVLFLLPSVALVTGIVFAVALQTKNTLYPFVAVFALWVVYLLSNNSSVTRGYETFFAIIEPFGNNAAGLADGPNAVANAKEAKAFVPVSHWLIGHRLLWGAITGILLAVSYWKFSFLAHEHPQIWPKAAAGTPRPGWKKQAIRQVRERIAHAPTQPFEIRPAYRPILYGKQFLSQVKTEIGYTVRNPAFLFVTFLVAVMLIISIISGVIYYRHPRLPVTSYLLEYMGHLLYPLLFFVIIFYSGLLVWKERETRMNEIVDATPLPSWLVFTGKLGTLLLLVGLLCLVAVLICVGVQLAFEYTTFEWNVYFEIIVLGSFPPLVLYSALALSIQAIVPNKYTGYFVCVSLVLLQSAGFFQLGITHNLWKIVDNVFDWFVYSDMNGLSPFAEHMIWFGLYRFLLILLLSILAVMLWPRGKEEKLAIRLRKAAPAFKSLPVKVAIGTIACLWLATTGFIYYNTNILNHFASVSEYKRRAADFEKKYKKYEHRAQPKITSVKYSIDLYPYEKKMFVKGELVLKNKTQQPIDSLHLLFKQFRYKIRVAKAKLVATGQDGYHIYAFQPALSPGDSVTLNYEAMTYNRGFANTPSTMLVNNGTFLYSIDVTPRIGYESRVELTDPKDRKDYGLPLLQEQDSHVPEATDTNALYDLKADADYVAYEALVSTAANQTAVAPGKLIRHWKKGDRAYFHYRMNKPIEYRFPVASGTYAVLREPWKHTNIEIYYHQPHAFNIHTMAEAVKNTLDYCAQHFSAYPYQDIRIIEFPRYRNFARASPGVVVYSEKAGFIDKYDEENEVDNVYYTAAHETAHQWWGTQVISAPVKGAQVITQSLATYTALVAIEKNHGKRQVTNHVKKFRDIYFRKREEKEPPLLYCEDENHDKGGLAFYTLRNYIGEEKLTEVLQQFLREYSYCTTPYPTALTLYERLKGATPDSLRYLLTDMFERVCFYESKGVEAVYTKQGAHTYEVFSTLSVTKRYVDSTGKETKAKKLADWIDVAVLGVNDKVLYKQRRKFTAERTELTLQLKEKPSRIVIDPDGLLLHKNEDRGLAVTLIEE